MMLYTSPPLLCDGFVLFSLLLLLLLLVVLLTEHHEANSQITQGSILGLATINTRWVKAHIGFITISLCPRYGLPLVTHTVEQKNTESH